MVAFESLQNSRVKGLHTQADAVHPVRRKHINLLAPQALRVRLDAEFKSGKQFEPAADEPQETVAVVGGEVGRRSSPPEQRADWLRTGKRPELDFQRPEIVADEMVLAGNEREVAIAAAMGAKWNVNIGRAGGVDHFFSVDNGTRWATAMVPRQMTALFVADTAVDENRRQQIVDRSEIIGQYALSRQLQDRGHFAEIAGFAGGVALGPGEGTGMPVASAVEQIIKIELSQRTGDNERIALR